MNLPLYFAAFEKNIEIGASDHLPLARVYAPDADYSNTDILICTDQNPSLLSEDEASVFCNACKSYSIQGIFFDFIRPLSGSLVRFAELVQKALPNCFYILPERYASVSGSALILCTPCLPQNSWESFCEQKQTAYAQRWALELIPYQLLYENGKKKQLPYHALQALKQSDGQKLSQAVCMSSREQCRHLIYDTPQTLREKLQIAANHGCQLSIGLWQELRYYF